MLLAFHIVLSVLVQISVACRNTADCPSCPVVSDCETNGETDQTGTTTPPPVSGPPESYFVSPPILTDNQSRILQEMGNEFENMSCEEVENMLYNTTQQPPPPPPIELELNQTMAIIDFYPEINNVNLEGGTVIGCIPNFGGGLQRKRSVSAANVCQTTAKNTEYSLALDRHGLVVFLPQDKRYNVLQTFQENVCTSGTCASNLGCQCEDQFSHTAMALVSYLKNNDKKFYRQEIQLRSCSGYV